MIALFIITFTVVLSLLTVSVAKYPDQYQPKVLELENNHHIQACKQIIEELNIKRVAIIGYTSSKHTHHYIHLAWYEAFSSLKAIPVIWSKEYILEKEEDTLFITEGQVCDQMPWNPRAYYLVHNVDGIPGHIPAQRLIRQQFWTKDCTKYSFPVLDQYHRLCHEGGELYMPWATNLLPEQFFPRRENLNQTSVIIGQHGDAYKEPLQTFFQSAKQVKNKHYNKVSNMKLSMTKINRSSIAPTLINPWQKKHGYIPCRIFKNISYGALTLTNSKQSYRALHHTIFYHEDEKVLGEKANDVAQLSQEYHEKSQLAWELAQSRHTYINRIYFILKCFQLKQAKQKHNTKIVSGNYQSTKAIWGSPPGQPLIQYITEKHTDTSRYPEWQQWITDYQDRIKVVYASGTHKIQDVHKHCHRLGPYADLILPNLTFHTPNIDFKVYWYQTHVRFPTEQTHDPQQASHIIHVPQYDEDTLVLDTLSKALWCIPSWSFLQHFREVPHEWEESLWYREEYQKLFFYFDSWKDLQEKLEALTYPISALEQIKQNHDLAWEKVVCF